MEKVEPTGKDFLKATQKCYFLMVKQKPWKQMAIPQLHKFYTSQVFIIMVSYIAV